MKNYLAPLEGVTTFVYRKAFDKIFGNEVDKYFAPFIVPHIKRDMNNKEIRELLPENNEGINLVPQILTDSASDLLRYEQIMHDLGYEEININIGCPSGTVTAKGRGAGFLGRLEELDHFLDEVYEKRTGKIGVKTRIGIENTEEFHAILEIYNKYPIDELTIHPRTMKQYYNGEVDLESFFFALEHSENTLVYNGDVKTVEDVNGLVEKAKKRCPDKTFDLMVGRGVIADPGLFRNLRTGQHATAAEINALIRDLERGYLEFVIGETQVVNRLKEIFLYMGKGICSEKLMKKIKKAKSLEEMHIYLNEMLTEKSIH